MGEASWRERETVRNTRSLGHTCRQYFLVWSRAVLVSEVCAKWPSRFEGSAEIQQCIFRESDCVLRESVTIYSQNHLGLMQLAARETGEYQSQWFSHVPVVTNWKM